MSLTIIQSLSNAFRTYQSYLLIYSTQKSIGIPLSSSFVKFYKDNLASYPFYRFNTSLSVAIWYFPYIKWSNLLCLN
jgi:hypothetical protein